MLNVAVVFSFLSMTSVFFGWLEAPAFTPEITKALLSTFLIVSAIAFLTAVTSGKASRLSLRDRRMSRPAA